MWGASAHLLQLWVRLEAVARKGEAGLVAQLGLRGSGGAAAGRQGGAATREWLGGPGRRAAGSGGCAATAAVAGARPCPGRACLRRRPSKVADGAEGRHAKLHAVQQPEVKEPAGAREPHGLAGELAGRGRRQQPRAWELQR